MRPALQVASEIAAIAACAIKPSGIQRRSILRDHAELRSFAWDRRDMRQSRAIRVRFSGSPRACQGVRDIVPPQATAPEFGGFRYRESVVPGVAR